MTLTATTLDTPDPRALAAFYRTLLGWTVGDDGPAWVTLRPPAGGVGLSFQRDPAYVRPTWPSTAGAQERVLRGVHGPAVEPVGPGRVEHRHTAAGAGSAVGVPGALGNGPGVRVRIHGPPACSRRGP
jgi:catechol 2,3-dioxygenase-like lactoylglutathione lyase family enzyme